MKRNGPSVVTNRRPQPAGPSPSKKAAAAYRLYRVDRVRQVRPQRPAVQQARQALPTPVPPANRQQRGQQGRGAGRRDSSSSSAARICCRTPAHRGTWCRIRFRSCGQRLSGSMPHRARARLSVERNGSGRSSAACSWTFGRVTTTAGRRASASGSLSPDRGGGGGRSRCSRVPHGRCWRSKWRRRSWMRCSSRRDAGRRSRARSCEHAASGWGLPKKHPVRRLPDPGRLWLFDRRACDTPSEPTGGQCVGGAWIRWVMLESAGLLIALIRRPRQRRLVLFNNGYSLLATRSYEFGLV